MTSPLSFSAVAVSNSNHCKYCSPWANQRLVDTGLQQRKKLSDFLKKPGFQFREQSAFNTGKSIIHIVIELDHNTKGMFHLISFNFISHKTHTRTARIAQVCISTKRNVDAVRCHLFSGEVPVWHIFRMLQLDFWQVCSLLRKHTWKADERGS